MGNARITESQGSKRRRHAASSCLSIMIGILSCSSVDARVTSNFGVRRDPINGIVRMHAGMDMAGRTGTPIYATGDGYVRRARPAGGYGNLVEIEHGFGYETRYGHLSGFYVREGQFVRRGQLIAVMGSTGHSTGPHLHYEVRIGGRAVPPASYMQIVFSRQPDWNAVRMSATYSAPRPVSQPRAYVAMAGLSRQRYAPRAVGDLSLSFNAGTGSSGFSAGHASFGP